MFQTIAFDADDTLWHNENLFTDTHEKFADMLSKYHSHEWVEKHLFEAETRNLHLFGYGIKGYMLSMIETAIELTEGRVTGQEIQRIIDYGKSMLKAPVEPLEGVRETLEALSKRYDLMVITKGDLFDQENKIAASGLGDFFESVEIVSEKTVDAYRNILLNHELAGDRVMMVGNSLKSDILPALEAGMHATHIPYKTTWAHEQVSECAIQDKDFHALKHMNELIPLIDSLGG